jgi:DUF2934 family protein
LHRQDASVRIFGLSIILYRGVIRKDALGTKWRHAARSNSQPNPRVGGGEASDVQKFVTRKTLTRTWALRSLVSAATVDVVRSPDPDWNALAQAVRLHRANISPKEPRPAKFTRLPIYGKGSPRLHVSTAPKPASIFPMNLHEKVYQLTEQLAYYLWEQRGSPSGSPELDWEVAEQTLGEFLDSFRRRAWDSGIALGPDTSPTFPLK